MSKLFRARELTRTSRSVSTNHVGREHSHWFKLLQRCFGGVHVSSESSGGALALVGASFLNRTLYRYTSSHSNIHSGCCFFTGYPRAGTKEIPPL